MFTLGRVALILCILFASSCSEEEFAPQGIILSGGPESVHLDDAPKANSVVFELGVPVLGICYGMQAITDYFGGEVISSDEKEFGYAQVEVTRESKLLSGIFDSQETNPLLDVWMSHGDKVSVMPEGFVKTSQTSCLRCRRLANVMF